MVFKNAKVNGVVTDIRVEKGVIQAIEKSNLDGIDLGGKTVIPGLVDVHTHGCVGFDTMDAQFEEMSIFLAKNGVTSWLPTTMTVSMEQIDKTLRSNTKVKGAQILGFHMEGPYISPKYKGAQNERYIKNPTLEEFNRLPNIKIVTIAPELEGSMEFIKGVKDCVVSLGHTACNYDIAMEAIEAGANCLTHTYNAMPSLHHREPGPIGAAVEKNIYAQLICDGLHIHKAAVQVIYKSFGSDKMVLISDSMRATGLCDGDYEFGGQTITVKDSVARTQEGAIAGSTSTLWQCVNKAVEFGISFDEAVKMASTTPAKMLGLKKGLLEVGYDADMVVLDDNNQISMTIIAGDVCDFT